MPHKRATDAVFRNLAKEHPDYPMRYVWESMPYVSLEDFRKSAIGWLGDRSELSGWSFGNADWQEVYEYFKRQHTKD